jgi:hypothetical protein
MMRGMNPHVITALHAMWITLAGTLALALLLSIIPRLGMIGWRVSQMLCRAPLLDAIVASFTWVPWVIGAVVGGWAGFAGAVAGQFLGLWTWCLGHELAFRDAARGPRIVKFHAKIVGRWRNHLALWVTLVALPIFWGIRFVQMTLWWTLPVLLNFPAYKQSDWINVSRHKFEGLVGHDLVWCLYCDWMTGVYAMGAEMLRNVESFWCPIRFYEGKKCANCAVDFPDVNNGWVAPDRSMADVVSKMEEMYGEGHREWFGHPARLTVKGQPIHLAAGLAPRSATEPESVSAAGK